MNKSIFLITFLILTTTTLFSQEQKQLNQIKTKLFPTYDHDHNYFFLRKVMRYDEFLFGGEYTPISDGSFQYNSKVIVPIKNSNKWNFSLPVYMNRYDFGSYKANVENKKIIHSIRTKALLSFFHSERWHFNLTLDYRLIGNEAYLTENTGNTAIQNINVKRLFNKKLSLLLGVSNIINWEGVSTNKISIEPNVQLIWTPSDYLRFMVGYPAIGAEWSTPIGLDITCSAIRDQEDVHTVIAMRQSINKYFDVGIRYLREGYSKLYVPREYRWRASPDNISFYYNKFQVEVGIRPEPNTLLQFFGGTSSGRNFTEVYERSNQEMKKSGGDVSYFGFKIIKSVKTLKIH